VVGLGGRELLGQAVDRRRRRGDDLAHPRLARRLEDVVGPVDQDLEREPRLLGALGDPDRGQVEDGVDARHELAHERAVADVAVDEADVAVRLGPCEVLPPSADEVVEDDDLLGAGEHELVGYGRPDGACASGDQHSARGAHGRSRSVMRLRSWLMDAPVGRPDSSSNGRGGDDLAAASEVLIA
jgi:hypothetical protein